MLVLSRKLGDKICIGDDIFITVVALDRGNVRLGIEAPRSVPVHRQEILGKLAGEAHPVGSLGLSRASANCH